MAIYIIHNIYIYIYKYSSNKVSMHNSCHEPKMSNDKEEAVQLICLLEEIMSRQ